MALNPYRASGTSTEQALYESIITESIQNYGHDLYYVPRDIIERDDILNEDVLSEFTDSFLIEMYLETFESFEGDGRLLAKFGFEMRDQLTFIVSKSRFLEEGVGLSLVKPKEGDLLYYPMLNKAWEIKYVSGEKPFYQLGNLPTYNITAELFEYSSQNIDTGIPEIDEIQDNNSQTWSVTMTDVIGSYDTQEFVDIELPTSLTGTANVLDWDGTTLTLGTLAWADDNMHTLVNGTILSGQTSLTVGTVGDAATVEDPEQFTNDKSAQNSTFEISGDEFIDFGESQSIFGQP